MRKINFVDRYLSELIYYGGEARSRRYVMAHLRRLGANDLAIAWYMDRAALVGPTPSQGGGPDTRMSTKG